MIDVSDFMDAVRRNADRVRGYTLGHDGSDGKCDCIGLAIGAIRLAGGKYTGTHGSNWAARHEVTSLMTVSSAGQLRPGLLMLKGCLPGESGWNLPEKYRSGADQHDYYHAGVVLSVNPLDIAHCTTRNGKGGVYHDTKLGKWNFAAEMKQVDYGNEQKEAKTMKATVWTENGKPANMRQKQSTSSALIGKIPVGDEIEVIGENGDWAQVTWNGKTGFILSRFVNYPEIDVPTVDGETVTVTLPYGAAIELREALIKALGVG